MLVIHCILFVPPSIEAVLRRRDFLNVPCFGRAYRSFSESMHGWRGNGMEKPARFVLKSLREMVYEYLKKQLNEGHLEQGSFLNLNKISEELGISKTPLRDALFQLESEGFITIFPRRGAMVNVLTLEKIRNIYQIVGALESAVLSSVGLRLRSEDLDRMETYNEEMRAALEVNDFDLFYAKNLSFHNVFLDYSDNEDLLHSVRILKERLYDFPRSKGFVKDWEVISTGEHAEILRLLRKEDYNGAAEYVRDVHWSFAVQERFIRKYYFARSAELDRKRGE